MSRNAQSIAFGRWKVLYRAAIFAARPANESRIDEAQQAIIARARELYSQSGTEVDAERESLEDALYALRALRSVVQFKTAA